MFFQQYCVFCSQTAKKLQFGEIDIHQDRELCRISGTCWKDWSRM